MKPGNYECVEVQVCLHIYLMFTWVICLNH